MARHAHITQNNKQYLKKEVGDEIDFLHADKQENFCKLILWFLIGVDKNFQNSQINKFAMSLQYLKKEVRDEIDF